MAAEYTIWFSAIGFVPPTDSGATLVRGNNGATATVRTTRIGARDEVLLPLCLPSNVQVRKVLLGCSVSNERSIVTQIRLSEEREPPAATVVHDDGTDRTNTTPAVVESVLRAPHAPNGGMTLVVFFILNDPADSIDLGSVGIVVEPV